MSKIQLPSLVQHFQNTPLIVTPDKSHDFLITTAELAKGYGVTDQAILAHRRRNESEFVENTHFVSHFTNCNVGNKISFKQYNWTKRGVIRLGMFIKSPRAVKFRNWAENLIIEQLETPKSPTRLAVEINLKDVYFKNVVVSSQRCRMETRGLELNGKLFLLQGDIYKILSISSAALYKRRERNQHKLTEGEDYVRVRNLYWWNQECLLEFGYIFSVDAINEEKVAHRYASIWSTQPEPLQQSPSAALPNEPHVRQYVFDEAQVSGHTLGNEKLITDSINALVHKYCTYDMMAGIRSQNTPCGKIYAVEDILMKLIKKLPEQMKAFAFNRN